MTFLFVTHYSCIRILLNVCKAVILYKPVNYTRVGCSGFAQYLVMNKLLQNAYRTENTGDFFLIVFKEFFICKSKSLCTPSFYAAGLQWSFGVIVVCFCLNTSCD